MRFPKEKPFGLVLKQLEKGLRPEGVFISFNTDPLLRENYANTWALISLLRAYDIRVAVLSKEGVLLLPDWEIRHGITLVSLSNDFAKVYEPNATTPLKRLDGLKLASEEGAFTWVSIEPCMPPAIVKQDLRELLEEISFVNFILMGKLNYDKRANTSEAIEYYQRAITILRDFCNDHSIRYYVKRETILNGRNNIL